MNSATFLLAINCSTGLSFAVAFVALFKRSGIALGLWCAGGFLSAAMTTVVELCANSIPSVHLTSALSFGSLLFALTLIATGLALHFNAQRTIPYFMGWCGICFIINVAVVFYLPRGTWGHGLGYQIPFAAILAASSGMVLAKGRKEKANIALVIVLALSAAQFLMKAILEGRAGHGPSVRAYIFSVYAFYSQTAGGILSICLGLSLMGVIVAAMMEKTVQSFELDSMSGVLNRGAFMRHAEEFVERTTQKTVILCDLDHFKSVNDRFGHAAGDEVIHQFGKNLRGHFGEESLCGRLGGEEFCVLMSGVSLDEIADRVESFRTIIRESDYTLVPKAHTITASFGIAMLETSEPFARALHRADMALYRAKAEGRDRYRISPSSGEVDGNMGSAATSISHRP